MGKRGTLLVLPEEKSVYDPFVTAERTGATFFPTVPAHLDVGFVASALGAMTERCAYLWFVYGEPVDLATAADQITAMWAAALHLQPSPR